MDKNASRYPSLKPKLCNTATKILIAPISVIICEPSQNFDLQNCVIINECSCKSLNL